MARRYTVQPAQNDPVWGAPAPLRVARALTANVEPLRTGAGVCYPGVPPEIIRAWYFRLLKEDGAPACLQAVCAGAGRS